MNIVYIHQYFCTNQGSSGTRSYDDSRHMAKMGHHVTVITGLLDIGDFRRLPWYQPFKKVHVDGFDVIVCNAYYSNHYGVVARYWAFLWFAFLATFAALSVRKPDIVFATSTPLTVGIPGWIAAVLKRAPFVFEVRDLWPESFIRSGWLKGTELSVRLMSAMEKFLYARARKICLVSPGFEKRLLERGYPPEKLRTILLGADSSLFDKVTPDVAFQKQHGLEGKIVAIYTGAHGKANGLDYVLGAAEKTLSRPDVAYVLIGDGSEKPRLQQAAKDKGLTNVIFADTVPKEKLPGILAVCHIGLMILKHIGEPRPVTPNKIFDYMFAGMPSLVNFEGPTWDMVQREQCGYLVDALKPEDLAAKVLQLADSAELRRQLGQAGHKAAWERYDRKIIAGQLAETFEQVLAAGGRRAKT